ncbi:hypothetical protein [Chelatococcus reniformis]|uniref:Uncharacterized protein n=1 Tax=Chelatococcus reniformis TaxID=1494448 RepID=A0A916XGG0_9HYPH|nr:hypothetical protein [Chelatococcus reniformis]GGC71533.1 hypothetical protein GCM10010994_32530 [Chelatococcus reniformis]
MDAQVRTIVASTGERLVVLPEEDYRALLNAAHPAAPASLAERGRESGPAAAPKAIGAGGRARCSLEDVLLRG